MFWEAIESACDRMEKSKTLLSISLIISLIVGLVFSVFYYHSVDKIPATFDDFAQLNEKLVAVENDHSLILEEDAVITIKNGTIEYTVENQQCEMTGKYDSEYRLIEKQQKDKYTHFLTANLICIPIMIFFAFVCYVILGFLIWSVLSIVNIITALVKKYKKNHEHDHDRITMGTCVVGSISEYNFDSAEGDADEDTIVDADDSEEDEAENGDADETVPDDKNGVEQ